jgi:hypothetical protein
VSDPAAVRAIRDRVAAVLDDDGFVLAVDGALEAVAEHARLRAMDEDTFVERARAAFQAVAREHAVPLEGIDL